MLSVLNVARPKFVRDILVASILFTSSTSASYASISQKQLESAVADVGSIEIKLSNSGDNISVVLIPEMHGLTLVQLEEALVLQRLDSTARISALILEGLLPDAAAQLPPPGGDPSEGIALIKDGTISAAEFMYLYKGTKLLPGETHETHDPNAEPTDICGLLGEYAATVLLDRADLQSRAAVVQYAKAVKGVNATVEKLNSLSKSSDDCEISKTLSKLDRDTVASSTAIAAHVPELGPYVKRFCPSDNSVDFLQIDQELGVLKELRKLLSDKLPDDQVHQMDDYEKFIVARDKSSTIMIDNLAKEVTEHRKGVAVAIIGAAHLNRMIEKLNAENIGVATVNLESMTDATHEKLHAVSTNRRFLLPVDTGPLGDALVNALSPGDAEQWAEVQRLSNCRAAEKHKEKTVLNTPWFKGKSEFHAALDAVANAALGGGGAGEPPIHPPGTYSLSKMLPDDDPRWNKTNVRVLIAQGFVIYPDKEPKIPHVIVPVVFTNDSGKQVGEPIWASISIASRSAKKFDTPDSKVESLLQEAIADEKGADAKPESKAKPESSETGKTEAKSDGGVPIRISMNTEAKLYKSKEAAFDSVGGTQ